MTMIVVQAVEKNIYQGYTYRKDLSTMSQEFKKSSKWRINILIYPFL